MQWSSGNSKLAGDIEVHISSEEGISYEVPNADARNIIREFQVTE